MFPRKTIQHHSNPVYAPTTNAKETEVEPFYEKLQDFLEQITTRTKKHVLFTIGNWNEKLGTQEIPGATGKFVL